MRCPPVVKLSSRPSSIGYSRPPIVRARSIRRGTDVDLARWRPGRTHSWSVDRRPGGREATSRPVTTTATTRCCASGSSPSRAARRSTSPSASAAGAWRGPKDPANVIWTVGDRGPNIACSEMKADRRHRLRALQGRAERPRLSDAVLCPVDLSRDAAGRRHLPRHRRHHAQGPRRPPAHRHAQSAQDRGDRERHGRHAASRCRASSTASMPKASCASPTAPSGSATRTARRSRISPPTAA